MNSLKVAIVLGSDSDLPVIERTTQLLEEFGLAFDARVISAHRTPERAREFAMGAEDAGYGVIIAVAGGAAHLPGVIASMTPLPVIGVPVATSVMGGMDSLLSIAQMPSGVPVATVGVGKAAGANAAILAAQVLSVADPRLRAVLKEYKKGLAERVAAKDARVAEKLSK